MVPRKNRGIYRLFISREILPIHGSNSLVHDGVYPTHTLRRFSELDCWTTKRVPIAKAASSEKLWATCFQRRRAWHRQYSNRGDLDHGKSAQGRVSVCCICESHRPSRHFLCGSHGTTVQQQPRFRLSSL